jgi:hypothetical protein
MLSTDPMPKPLIISRPIAQRTRLATLAVFVISVYLGQGCYGVGAAEINAASASKPVGFADIVAKVTPAVIAVTVRLENDVEVEDNDKSDVPSQSQPFGENSP